MRAALTATTTTTSISSPAIYHPWVVTHSAHVLAAALLQPTSTQQQSSKLTGFCSILVM